MLRNEVSREIIKEITNIQKGNDNHISSITLTKKDKDILQDILENDLKLDGHMFTAKDLYSLKENCFDRLLKVNIYNQDLPFYFINPKDEDVILVAMSASNSVRLIVCKPLEDNIICKFFRKHSDGTYEMEEDIEKSMEAFVFGFLSKAFSLYYLLNKIVTNNENIIEKSSKLVNEFITKKSKKNTNKRKKSVITIRQYRLNYTSKDDLQPKRKHEIKCECWEVRGFWRHYKSGKKVWIEGFQKGAKRNQAKSIEKEYKMEVR